MTVDDYSDVGCAQVAPYNYFHTPNSMANCERNISSRLKILKGVLMSIRSRRMTEISSWRKFSSRSWEFFKQNIMLSRSSKHPGAAYNRSGDPQTSRGAASRSRIAVSKSVSNVFRNRYQNLAQTHPWEEMSVSAGSLLYCMGGERAPDRRLTYSLIYKIDWAA